eukprot:1146366-Pelagomonas_calceolata.AAC.6
MPTRHQAQSLRRQSLCRWPKTRSGQPCLLHLLPHCCQPPCYTGPLIGPVRATVHIQFVPGDSQGAGPESRQRSGGWGGGGVQKVDQLQVGQGNDEQNSPVAQDAQYWQGIFEEHFKQLLTLVIWQCSVVAWIPFLPSRCTRALPALVPMLISHIF